MPEMARANGMWRGPQPVVLRDLSFCEAKVINLARVYVSIKRVFLDRGSYARARQCEARMRCARGGCFGSKFRVACWIALGVSGNGG